LSDVKKSLATAGRILAIKGIVAQIFVSLVCIGTAIIFQNNQVVSVIFGCLSFLVPHSIFAYWVFRYAGATNNEIVVQSFSQGMKLKLILTSGFFVIAFSHFNAHPLFLLGAYVITMFSQWLAMYIIKQ
jgi:ATP synthase protein I